MQKRIALLYDFDYTLCNGYMQQYGLMQELGFDDIYKFFKANDDSANCTDMDKGLSLMAGTLRLAREKGCKPTREYLKQFGKDVEFYPGVEDWFEKINNIGKEYGYEIEHYVISGGLREIIEGCKIADKLKRIYACFYAYDKEGIAYWPSQVVNYTSKTQYIYRVRKNVLDDLASLTKINAKMDDEEVLPFSNIIYFGDGETDIPSFKVVKNSGGMSICVYDSRKEGSRQGAEKCFREGRVNYFLPADYTEGSELYELVKSYIESIMKKTKVE